jgi:predicted metalloprotease with PDZ domain
LFDRVDVDQVVDIDVFRRDELRHVKLIAAAPLRDTCYLGFDTDADEAALQRRREWLGG